MAHKLSKPCLISDELYQKLLTFLQKYGFKNLNNLKGVIVIALNILIEIINSDVFSSAHYRTFNH